MQDRLIKKEHQKTDKLKELNPDNPKIKLLNLDILKLLKDIYMNKYLYSKTEKNTNNNVKASIKKESVKETECDIDGISKYITKKSLVQAASEKLIKGRWSMNKATLVNELKKKFKTIMEFCEYIQGLYNTSTKKKPTAKKNVKVSKKKTVTPELKNKYKSPVKKAVIDKKNKKVVQSKKQQVKNTKKKSVTPEVQTTTVFEPFRDNIQIKKEVSNKNSLTPEVQTTDTSTMPDYTYKYPPLNRETIFDRFMDEPTLKKVVRKVIKNKKNTIVEARKQCKDLNTCLMLGEFSHAILAFFTAIKHFKHVLKIKNINLAGNNAKVFHVHTQLSDYNAYSILKIPRYKEEVSDNVVYEFLMGLVINLFTQTPNTIKTLNLYKHKSQDLLHNTLSQQNITSEILKENVELIAYVNYENTKGLIKFNENEENIKTEISLIKHSCLKNDHFALEMLYIPNTFMFSETTDTRRFPNFRNFWKHEIGFVMFQLYAFLKVYHNIFVHNDLHHSNILLCQIPNHHFEYIYKEGKETMKFTSPFLVKIIDYSRSYITEESERLFDLICNETKCNPECGKDHGYSHAFLSTEYELDHSMDLYPLYYIEKHKNIVVLDTNFRKIVVSLIYDDERKNTVEVTKELDIISTTLDAYKRLKTYVKHKRTVKRTTNLYGTFVIKIDEIPSIRNIYDSSERMKKAFMFHRHV